ncbi:MAG: inositol monophosphatase family protein [Ectothiorhodospiraceae bacterium]|jgi:myo-inositol-1(or 4)-monophosphatase|nr:inositol monophosphatase family protein [Ectothiorhodospiraceae bacterium]
MLPDIEVLKVMVCEAAREELLPRFSHVLRSRKQDGSFVTEADLAMQDRLRRELAVRWPDIPLLGEEMTVDEQTALLADGSRPLWCLDPLDGTTNFAAGVPFFAVSLALLVEGRVALGVIVDPVREECFSAVAGGGASLGDMPLHAEGETSELAQSVALIDFKRLPVALRERLTRGTPFASQRNFGSCALEWCWLAAGRGQLLLHGGERLWDFAAGTLILDEAGGASCTLDGEPVFRPGIDKRSVIAAGSAALFDAWRGWVMTRS